MKEEIVVILDANPSMGEEIYANDDDENSSLEDTETTLDDFLGTTKFDVARYMVQELFSHAAAATTTTTTTTTTGKTRPEDQTTRVLALITLGGRLTEGIPNPPRNRKRSSSVVEDPRIGMDHATTGGSSGCRCYCCPDEGDSESSLDGVPSLLQSLHASPPASLRCHGDFVTGMVRATEVLVRHTTVGAERRRIVLVTDARHKVLVPNNGDDDEQDGDPMEALVQAINRLRAMGCTLEVVGMGFTQTTPSSSSQSHTSEPSGMPPTKEAMDDDKSTAHMESESEESESDGDSSDGDSDSDSDSEASQEDWSDVQDQNEILVMDLVEKLGGCVRAIGGKNRTSSLEDWYGMTRNSQTPPKDPSKIIQGDHKLKTVDHRREGGAMAIPPNRDSSSLRPHPGTRILYWNGTDDILLPEWIQIAKPSCWSGSTMVATSEEGLSEAVCFWIQIDDPLRPKDDGFVKLPETKNRCAPGNWLVGCDLDSVDLLWEKIAIATAYGRLGPSSRVSPTKHLLQRMLAWKEHPTATGNGCSFIGMIYVGVTDSKDRAELQRILDVLRKDLEIPSCYLRFQPDPGAKGEHDTPRLYTAKEVLAWQP